MSADCRFACDAMLGGLARWLRAAGYDANWCPGIDDWALIRLAREENRVLLSSDGGIFKIGIVRDGGIASIYIPHGLNTQQQLALVLQRLNLIPRETRCMNCGGTLELIPKELAKNRAPERTFQWLERFFECTRCKQLFWEGTHWRRIQHMLERATVQGSAPETRG